MLAAWSPAVPCTGTWRTLCYAMAQRMRFYAPALDRNRRLNSPSIGFDRMPVRDTGAMHVCKSVCCFRLLLSLSSYGLCPCLVDSFPSELE